MHPGLQRRSRSLVVVGVGVLMAWAGQAHGQAWVPPPNSLDLDVGYQFGSNNGHYGGSAEGSYVLQGVDQDVQRTHTAKFGVGYSTPLKGLAVDAMMFVVNSAYTGDLTYLPHGPDHTCTGTPGVDQVCTHGDPGTKLTDGLLDVRYELPFHPAEIAITPVAGVTVPLTDYPTIGHNAYGRHRMEGRVGLEVGRTFLEKAYADLLYTYSIVERFNDCIIAPAGSPIAGMCVPDSAETAEKFNLNRSDLRLVLGYFILPQLSLYGAGTWRHTHDDFLTGDLQAIRAKRMAMEPLTVEEMVKATWHDVIGSERYVIVGGGINYQPIDQLSVQVGVYDLIWGDFVPKTLAANVNLTWTVF